MEKERTFDLEGRLIEFVLETQYSKFLVQYSKFILTGLTRTP